MMHFKLKFRAIPNRGNQVGSSVESVNGKTGAVVLNAADVGADPFGSAQAVQESVDALSSNVDQLSNRVDQKANTEDVDQALSLKSDKTYVDSQDQSLLDQINTKVDANYVNTVTADKASVSYVDTQDQALSALFYQALLNKADVVLVNLGFDDVYRVLGLKADKTYVDTQDANLSILISSKTSKAYVDQQDNALSGRIDQKADANAVEQSLSLKADLINGKIPESQLPSVVDDVLNGYYVNSVSFNDVNNNAYTPEEGKIYVDVNMNKTYRWTGTIYTQIGGGDIVLGETSATAYRGDRGKSAYDHSLSSGNPHNSTTSDIPEGVNLYHTDPRVRMTQLTGINVTNTAQLVATDYLITAMGKLQGQINTKTALVLGETATDAYRGDRGKVAYDHSQVSGNPHNTVTGQISETTNLWFTETRVLNTVIAGVVFTNPTAVTQTDTLVQAVGKLQAQINTKTSLALGTTSITAMAGNTTTSGITEGANLYFTDTRAKASAIAAPLTGLSVATGGVITATDTVLAAMGKLQNQVTANGGGGSASSPTWVDITTIGTVAAYVTPVSVQVTKFQGMLWIRGTFNVNTSVATNSELFRISNLGAAYKPYAYSTAGTARLLMLISSYNLSTAAQKFIGFSALGNITNSTQAASVDVIFEAKTALSTSDGTLNIPPTIIGTLAI